uniref:Tudor domain-containing protein n=1 Tax=Paramoeba aestuarina TaxID=180227 RepID=A0A7S4KVQ4_9EUKA
MESKVQKKIAPGNVKNEYFSPQNPPLKDTTVEGYSSFALKYYPATVKEVLDSSLVNLEWGDGSSEIVPFRYMRPVDDVDAPKKGESITIKREESSPKKPKRSRDRRKSSRQNVSTFFSLEPGEMWMQGLEDIFQKDEDLFQQNNVKKNSFYYYATSKESHITGLHQLGKLVGLIRKDGKSGVKEIFAKLIPVELLPQHLVEGQFVFPCMKIPPSGSKCIRVPLSYLKTEPSITTVIKHGDLHKAYILMK